MPPKHAILACFAKEGENRQLMHFVHVKYTHNFVRFYCILLRTFQLYEKFLEILEIVLSAALDLGFDPRLAVLSPSEQQPLPHLHQS